MLQLHQLPRMLVAFHNWINGPLNSALHLLLDLKGGNNQEKHYVKIIWVKGIYNKDYFIIKLYVTII